MSVQLTVGDVATSRLLVAAEEEERVSLMAGDLREVRAEDAGESTESCGRGELDCDTTGVPLERQIGARKCKTDSEAAFTAAVAAARAVASMKRQNKELERASERGGREQGEGATLCSEGETCSFETDEVSASLPRDVKRGTSRDRHVSLFEDGMERQGGGTSEVRQRFDEVVVALRLSSSRVFFSQGAGRRALSRSLSAQTSTCLVKAFIPKRRMQ